MLYLDHAASAPLSQAALDAMHPWLTGGLGNPASVHGAGKQMAAALEAARELVAELLSTPADARVAAEEVVFTSGGSESNAMAVLGLARAARDRDPARTRLLVSAVEHSSVLDPAAQLAEREGFELVALPVDGTGAVRPDVLAEELGLGDQMEAEGDRNAPPHRDDLRGQCALVAVQAVNNEVGALQPIAEVAALARAAGAPVMVDAVAAVGAVELAEIARHADALTLSAHKFSGPQGAGLLRLAPGTPFVPLMPGAQERGRRAGTPGVANVLGMAAALQDALGRTAHSEQHRLRARLEATVLHAADGRARATGPTDPALRSPFIASFVFPGLGGETLLLELEERGVLCSSGSACHAGSTEPSHVLRAMGLSPDEARSAVRMSVGPEFAEEDLASVAEAVTGAVRAVTALAV